MALYKSSKNTWTLILLLVIGALAGSAAAGAVAPHVPFLAQTATIGLSPTSLNLYFMTLTLGFSMTLGPLTVIGLIIAFYIYRRI